MFMVIIYPSYQVLFETVNQTNYELPVLLLLPTLKLILKNISTFTILHKEDTIPEQVIFTVDFFDAFLPRDMHEKRVVNYNGNSDNGCNLAQTALEMQELHQRTQGVLERLNRALEIKNYNQNLLVAVRTLCEACNFDTQQKRQTQAFEYVSQEGEKILKNMDRHPRIGSRDSSFKLSSQESTRRLSMSARISRWKRGIQRVVRIQPKVDLAPGSVEPVTVSQTSASKVIRRSRPTNDNLHILHEALEVLFTNECLLLTEYLETIVPILYANFVLVMVHLPSVHYHAEMLGVTRENVGSTIQNVLIYALLELASFVVLAVIMWGIVASTRCTNWHLFWRHNGRLYSPN
ncbi:hypothetical protein GQ600_2066 [Phytophthora cactorum]|nr:hypothetical protein GQ600_2066 [Phytophthora cactorum]